jgi:hypothetical protein
MQLEPRKLQIEDEDELAPDWKIKSPKKQESKNEDAERLQKLVGMA